MAHRHRPTRRSIILLLVALLLLAGRSPAASDPFAPLPSGHWAYSALEALGHAGLLEATGLGAGDGSLTRYEVADLIAQASEELHQGVAGLSPQEGTELALARLYLMAGRLDSGFAPEASDITGLDRLQARRQLFWVVPAVHRLEASYRETGSGPVAVGRATQVGRRATLLYERLLQELPPALVAAGRPEVERLELALTGRLVQEGESTADLAARVDRVSRALRQLQSGFGPELETLRLELESPVELPDPERPRVVTLEDLRNSTETARSSPDHASFDSRIPLGSGESLEARVGVEREPGSPAVRPGVAVGLGWGEARIQAGWRLIDFSDLGSLRGEGEARLELRF